MVLNNSSKFKKNKNKNFRSDFLVSSILFFFSSSSAIVLFRVYAKLLSGGRVKALNHRDQERYRDSRIVIYRFRKCLFNRRTKLTLSLKFVLLRIRNKTFSSLSDEIFSKSSIKNKQNL